MRLYACCPHCPPGCVGLHHHPCNQLVKSPGKIVPGRRKRAVWCQNWHSKNKARPGLELGLLETQRQVREAIERVTA